MILGRTISNEPMDIPLNPIIKKTLTRYHKTQGTPVSDYNIVKIKYLTTSKFQQAKNLEDQ